MTLALLLIPYGLFLLVYLFFSVVALYHLLKFGVQNFTTFLATFLYIAVSAIILFISFTALADVHWATPLFEGVSFLPPT